MTITATAVLISHLRRILAHHEPEEAQRLCARLLDRYEPERPCAYLDACLLTGRCPKNPVCNH